MRELFLSYETFRPALQEGRTSCKEAVDFFLQQIERNNPRLNALLEVYETSARARAEELDQALAQGHDPGPLTGMVVAIKDNMALKDHFIGASSRILEGFRAVYTATAIQRIRDAGAILIGRCNCDEFAMGGSNENSAYGPVRNAARETQVAGGSSGGSAVAVQAHFCMAALGSDTGGSVRQPASFTGTIGLRPTYGRISRYGLYAFASSMDQIGPLAHTVSDVARLMHVMAGADPHDATASQKPPPRLTPKQPETALRLAHLPEVMNLPGLDAEIKTALQAFLNQREAEGHALQEASFPFMNQVVPTYYVVANAEASSNLSRYAGMLYGRRAEAPQSLQDAIIRSRSEGFGAEVQRRIMLGTFVLSEGYYEAYYGKAQKVRALIRQTLEDILKDADAIVLPTTPTCAFRLGAHEQDPVAMYLEDVFTVQAALAGLPAISVPQGVHTSGLPFGLQIIGRAFDEERLLGFAQQITSSPALRSS